MQKLSVTIPPVRYSVSGHAFGAKHRRRVGNSQVARWRSNLPTDPESQADEYSDFMAGRHRAGRHAIPAEYMVGEREFRNTPHNVCWGKHCIGRAQWVATHRRARCPYHM